MAAFIFSSSVSPHCFQGAKMASDTICRTTFVLQKFNIGNQWEPQKEMMLKMRFSKERVNIFQVDKVRACHHNIRQNKLKETAMQKEHGIFRKLERVYYVKYKVRVFYFIFVWWKKRVQNEGGSFKKWGQEEDWYQRLLVVFRSILLLPS